MVTGCHSVTKGLVPGNLLGPKFSLNSARDMGVDGRYSLVFLPEKKLDSKHRIFQNPVATTAGQQTVPLSASIPVRSKVMGWFVFEMEEPGADFAVNGNMYFWRANED